MLKILSPSAVLINNLNESISAKEQFVEDQTQLRLFERAVISVINCYRIGGRLYIAGNGGSAADAQHLAAEFVSKLSRDRGPLPAEALTVDTSILTAIGNDYGFEHVFSRQILGKMTSKDVFLGITTSGNSKNIINAIHACKTIGVTSIVFAGKNGGAVKEISDICIVAKGARTSVIQELHIALAHTMCQCVEDFVLDKI